MRATLTKSSLATEAPPLAIVDPASCSVRTKAEKDLRCFEVPPPSAADKKTQPKRLESEPLFTL